MSTERARSILEKENILLRGDFNGMLMKKLDIAESTIGLLKLQIQSLQLSNKSLMKSINHMREKETVPIVSLLTSNEKESTTTVNERPRNYSDTLHSSTCTYSSDLRDSCRTKTCKSDYSMHEDSLLSYLAHKETKKDSTASAGLLDECSNEVFTSKLMQQIQLIRHEESALMAEEDVLSLRHRHHLYMNSQSHCNPLDRNAKMIGELHSQVIAMTAERNHYLNKSRSLSKDLNTKLVSVLPLQSLVATLDMQVDEVS